ncbi:hypothetical protein [Methanobacterium spitsbergense]|uniref:Uncharacterized protein n=1 Tax=Methanobacterium spitsbergense TaxID=2874285 RepID=A0A8T5UY94_9EURY|nr:hypothetical protein [Methanobacterium spitsbergense]MBZ2166906.1 hypothetical protein [Methanobacterium spitsbergense]
MNMRLVFLIFLIVVFAAGFGFISYSQSTGISLNEAYGTGNIVITQNTSAGTVPHQVNIVNNGNDPVKVEVGDVLTAQSSQDLVIAENKTIKKNNTDTISAYCLDPSQRAIPGVKLKANGTSTNAVKQVIMASNINDLNNATNAQVQIWILTSGVDFNIYSRESVAVVETQKINYTKLRQIVSDAKTAISTRFNVNVNNIDKLNQNGTSNSTGIVGGFINWIKSTTGI